MRTKRKEYDYNSSDYGNEDYDQEEVEEDEYDQEEGGDSDFEAQNQHDRQGRNTTKSNAKSSRKVNDDLESEKSEESDDEDPFSPEIDQILNDKQVPLNTNYPENLAKISKASSSANAGTIVNQMWYLIKFVDQSYLHVKWMEETELEEYSYKAKQKIRRYWVQKEKKQRIKEYQERQKLEINQKTHHFSEDEEEDEFDEGLIKDTVALPEILLLNAEALEEQIKAQTIPVKDANGDDLTQYFDKNFAVVERILSTTLIFPVIHPRQSKQIKGKWQEGCLKVMTVLVNFRKNNLNIGLSFAEQFDFENEEQSDYFKVVRQPIDFMMIINRLYNKFYAQPIDFWNDLGMIFKNCRLYFKNPKSGMRKQCTALRCLAYYLYKDWFNEQKIKQKNSNPWATVKNPEGVQPSISKQQSFNKEEVKQQAPDQSQKTSSTPFIEKDATVVNLQSLLLKNNATNDVSPKVGGPVSLASTFSRNPVPNSQFDQFNQKTDFWSALNQQQIQNQNPQNQLVQNLQMNQNPNNFTQTLPKFNQIQTSQDQTFSEMARTHPTQSFYLPRQPQQDAINFNQLSSVLPGMNQQYQNQLLNGIVNNSSTQDSLSQLNKPWNLPSLNMDQSASQQQQFQLPGISQIQQNLANQSQFGLQTPNKQNDISQLNLYSQLLGGANLSSLLPQQNNNLLPSLNQFGNMNNQLQNSGIQLPSLSQLGTNFGNNFTDFFNSQSQAQNMSLQNNIFNMLTQSQQDLINQKQNFNFNQPNFNNLNMQQQLQGQDDYQFLLNQQLRLPGMPQLKQQSFSSLNQLSQANNILNNIGFSNNQALDNRRGQGQSMMGFDQSFQNNQFNYNMMNNPQSLQQMMGAGNNRQPTSQFDPIIDQNMNDNQDERYSEAIIPPAIIDPGEFNLDWLLEKGETLESVLSCFYLTIEEIENAINNKNNFDILYLIKWKNLSYTQSTWEPESIIKEIYKEKIQDYIRYNRSLDQAQRERLDQLIKNHKKMLRYTEKKFSHKKLDKMQENILTVQESKINRHLLNTKITELMGNAFNNFVQYNEAKGFLPQFKKPNLQLKDYQTIGLNWLIRAWHQHRNVVLADEMGLGKTIMTLALFDHLAKYCKMKGPFLILAPLTTLEHWKRIADEWTSLNSILYYDQGGAEGRQKIREWEWYYTDVTYKGTITQKSELFKFNVLITSFEVFMQDLNPILQEIPFIYIVVDEAHRLKNKQAKTLKLLKEHPCKRILLLTGTPVQNNTKELWTLLNYIEPEKFSSLENFLEEFGNLETYDQIQELHKILKPHFLRRLKEEVDKSIPPLQETVIEVGLTKLQNIYYKGIYGDNRMVLAKFGSNSVKTSQLNNIDIQLRKCCNHLFLLKGVEEELVKDCKDELAIYDKILQSSGKLLLLDKFIEKFKKENHKMLIFSQFKKMLDILELYLRMKGIPYEMLTGSVKTQDRISAIQRFNDDKNFGVFLLTTRAGGLGINLTSARVVIIFDSDWNPQNDLQAIARAHRIGQKFEVQVYRLITSKTYEEQMFERASKKLGMEQALFSKGAFSNEEEQELTGLTLRGLAEMKQDAKDIENLLKYGAYAFIDNDDEEDKNQFNKDIDEILATGKKKEFTYNKGVYTLNKSTFNASKYEKLPDVKDPEFWNKVLPFDTLVSINALEKKLKKEKKEISSNEKLQKEFIKDLEVVFNDFIEAKFDLTSSVASKKQNEQDEEKIREVLQKCTKLSGFKLLYIEKCKEWLREMLRTNKRQKKVKNVDQIEIESNENEKQDQVNNANDEAYEEEDENFIEEDDIIMDDSDEPNNNRNLRKRIQKEINPVLSQKQGDNQKVKGKRGRKPGTQNAKSSNTKVVLSNLMYDQEERKSGDGGGSDPNDFDNDEEGNDAYGEDDDDDDNEDMDNNEDESANSDEGGDGDYINTGYPKPHKKVSQVHHHQVKEETLRQEYDRDEYQYTGDDMDKDENRYGLRGRKRQRLGKEECLVTGSKSQIPKISEQFVKRNQKNGIVCSECLKPEPPLCNWICNGYCQRFFHEGCKDSHSQKIEPTSQKHSKNSTTQGVNKQNWQCSDCSDNVAICFCCKTKGQILLFPKKGKPKTADQLENNLNGQQQQFHVQTKEVEVEPIKDSPIQIKQEASEIKRSSSASSQSSNKSSSKSKAESEQSQPKDVKVEPNDDVEVEEDKDKEEEKVPIEQINLDELEKKPSQNEVIDEEDIDDGGQDVEEDENQIINNKQCVVRCTLGGCFKYYHVDCVYKNKNVSCINSMKVQRFRCPLHYCEFCQASGDSVLIVQCVDCPTAYHLKCLAQDTNPIRLTKKYILCGKHNYDLSEFKKYEEKAQQARDPIQKSQSMQLNPPNIQMYRISKSGSMKDKRKKKQKKKGSKTLKKKSESMTSFQMYQSPEHIPQQPPGLQLPQQSQSKYQTPFKQQSEAVGNINDSVNEKISKRIKSSEKVQGEITQGSGSQRNNTSAKDMILFSVEKKDKQR